MCCFLSSKQDYCVSWLQVAQFAYNNNFHSSTSLSPFKENFGYHSRIILGAPTDKVPAAYKLISTLKSLHTSIKANLTKAHTFYKSQAEKCQQPNAPLDPEIW